MEVFTFLWPQIWGRSVQSFHAHQLVLIWGNKHIYYQRKNFHDNFTKGMNKVFYYYCCNINFKNLHPSNLHPAKFPENLEHGVHFYRI